MTNASKEKAKFRNTSRWKKFRKEMYKKADGKDFLTGKPLRKGWQLHHLDMSLDNYKVLSPERFVCLNRTTHEMVHFLFRYKNYKDILRQANSVLDEMTFYNKGDKKNATGTQENKEI